MESTLYNQTNKPSAESSSARLLSIGILINVFTQAFFPKRTLISLASHIVFYPSERIPSFLNLNTYE
jgi:hypothetical protein